MTCYECEHSTWCPTHDGPYPDDSEETALKDQLDNCARYADENFRLWKRERALADQLAEEVRELAGYQTPALATWKEARRET